MTLDSEMQGDTDQGMHSDAAQEDAPMFAGERRTLRVKVYAGLGAQMHFDGTIPLLGSAMWPTPEPGRPPALDKWLRGGLYFSARQVYRQAYKDLRAVQLAFLLLLFVAYTWTRDQMRNGEAGGDAFFSFLILYGIFLLGWVVFERFVLLPRLHPNMEHVVQETLGPRFARQGWKLEYKVQNPNSPTGIAAFFEITPEADGVSIDIVTHGKDGTHTPFSTGKPAMQPAEEWIAVYRNMYAYVWCYPCVTRIWSLQDGVPPTMQASVDVFLWGALVEDLEQVLRQFRARKQCADCGVRIVSLVAYVGCVMGSMFLAIFLLDRMEKNGGGGVADPYIFMLMVMVTLVLSVMALLLCQVVLSAISDARRATTDLHPAARDVVSQSDFQEAFAASGYVVEYVSDEQAVPTHFLDGCCVPARAGRSFVRFVPSSMAYSRIPGGGSNAGSIV